MAGKQNNKKSDYQSRQMRRNQVIFSFVAVIVILSMVVTAFANF